MRPILLAAVALYAVTTFAAEKLIGVPFFAKGEVQTDTEIRTVPPYGPLNLFVGKDVAKLPKGSKVDILEKKTYGGFGGAIIWYKVAPKKEAGIEYTQPGWIYGGTEGSNQGVSLELK